MKKFLTSLLIILVLAFAFAAAGCGSSAKKENTSQGPTDPSGTSAPEDMPELEVTEEFEVIVEENQSVGGF